MMSLWSFSKKISKHHQRNRHTWSCENSEGWVRQFRRTICRSEIHPPKFS